MERPLAKLPAVHVVLQHPRLADAIRDAGRIPVRDAVRFVVGEARRGAAQGAPIPEPEALVERVLERVALAAAPPYPEVFNATGVLIHTNLGRAPCLAPALPSYMALEYDLTEGGRGERLAPVVSRLTRYFGCEAATVVNNNAAALVLLLSAHAAGRSVVVSRGELIEIGGSFRLPEIMRAAGANLVEVGCTNRTHLADYETVCATAPAAILVAHRSNFHLSGFVSSPPLEELVAAGHRWGTPVWVDQGSGCHLDLTPFGLRHEPTVREILATGADAVLFSADKLLGGPQAGIVLGTRAAIEPLRSHPLRRALRPDKSALVGLAATLDCFLTCRPEMVPLYRLLATDPRQLRRRAIQVARRLRGRGLEPDVIATRAVVGGGTTPDQTLPSWGVALPGGEAAATALRSAVTPVIARLEDGRLIVDLRAILPEQDARLAHVLAVALS
jgi:L-seryl-tRNA(Ser) seleniumtransferase